MIFDCDGVLVDSERIAVRVDVAVLAQLGWAMTEAEVVERFMGRTDAYMVSQIEGQLGRPLPANWEEPFQHLYREAFEAELTCSTICGSSHDFFGAIPIFNIATIPLSGKLLTPVNWTDTTV